MKTCKKCGELKAQSTDFFNMLPSGNYRGTCKVCMARVTKQHYYNDPQKVMDRVSKYNQQKEAAGGHCSASEMATIRVCQWDRCAYCSLPLDGGGELDHKIPVSRGGDSWPSNLAWACTTCNRDKHNKTVQEFVEWRARRLGR